MQSKPVTFVTKSFELPSLGAFIRDGFDYNAFCNAIDADGTLSPLHKQHIQLLFNPQTPVHLGLPNPLGALQWHMEAGASESMKNPTFDEPVSKRTLYNSQPLAANHPLHTMWQDVWQKSLAHYSLEAAEYEQAMLKKGVDMENDLAGYPLKAPKLEIMPNFPSINAAIGPRQDGQLGLFASPDFLTDLSEEQQRAVLFHEAQHALEPMLSCQAPMPYWLKLGISGLLTRHYTTRQNEYRADAHATRAGYGSTLDETLDDIMEAVGDMVEHRSSVYRHLAEHGFAFDVEKTKETLINWTEELSAFFQPGQKEEEQAAPEGSPSELAEKVSNIREKIFEKLGDTAEAVGERRLEHKIKSLNQVIAKAASMDSPKQNAEKNVESNGFRRHIERTRTRLQEARQTHPSNEKRNSHAAKVKPCPACTTDSPYATHSERLLTVSDTGIQIIRG